MEKHLQHLGFIGSLAYEIMQKHRGHQMNRVPYAYLELLSRVWAASKGLKRLADDIENEPELEFSAGLIIRTMILDFFISLRGYDIAQRGIAAGKPEQEVKEEVEAYFNTILGDGLKLSANHIARMESNGHITEEVLHNVLNNMTETYSAFLEPYANDKKVVNKYPKAPRNDELFDLLCENPELKNFTKHFDTYGLYSKYEHFSIMSYHAFRRDLNAQTKTLKDMIEILTLHTYQILVMLRYYNKNDEFLWKKQGEISEYIFKGVFDMSDEEIKQHFGS